MTRESKLALMIAVTLILLVGVLLSDHLSGAAGTEFDTPELSRSVVAPVTDLPGAGDPLPTLARSPVRAPEPLTAMQPEPMLAAERPAPIEIWQGPGPSESRQNPLAVALGKVDDTLGHIRDAEPPVLMVRDMFEPVRDVTVATGSRDPNRDRPIKPIAEPSPSRVQTAEATPAPRATPQRWKTHTVVSGDSLYRLADRYLGDGKRWRELQRLNADVLGDSETVRIGMVLKIAPEATPAPVSSAARPAPARETGPVREYVVLPGDSLGSISQKLLGTVRRMKDIVELNNLSDPDDIRVGQSLKIPAR
ncbi:MAG: LysM peptidoglycan-binding domain-containing protein [Phycisphaerales bacterium]|nr:LysM peptidoglycan-binding domain-containing protein [Planctomycetota bacterium]MCH8507421.1 LysM peptidoglycan-binding domain-containing protein [Phycisphaerales bacterium]